MKKPEKLSAVPIVLVVVFALLLVGCGESEELAAENEALGAELAETLEKMNEAESKVGELESALNAAQKEIDELKAEQAENAGKTEDNGLPVDVIDAQEADIEACILLVGAAYEAPDRNSRCTPVLENHYARVILKATIMHLDAGGSEDWYLVWCGALQGPSHNIGWVPAEEVAEYTEDNMTDIVWPLTLREGAELYVDEGLDTRADELFLSRSFYIKERGDEISALGTPGDGGAFYVRNTDIIYPEP